MRTVGNGRLLESSDDGLVAVTRWVERHPIATYLVSLASYAYATSTDWYRPSPADSMEIQFCLFPEDAPNLGVVNAKVKGMIAAYAARFGEYPFLDEKYGEAEFDWGGGMENQTITSLGSFQEGIGRARALPPVVGRLGDLPRLPSHLAERGLRDLL